MWIIGRYILIATGQLSYLMISVDSFWATSYNYTYCTDEIYWIKVGILCTLSNIVLECIQFENIKLLTKENLKNM